MPAAGPTLEELDVILAHTFPKLAYWCGDKKSWCECPRTEYWKRPWWPTRNIQQAWLIVGELNQEGYLITVSQGLNYYRHKGGRVAVQYKPENQNLHDCVVAETAPHAICLAAWRLKCVGLY